MPQTLDSTLSPVPESSFAALKLSLKYKVRRFIPRWLISLRAQTVVKANARKAGLDVKFSDQKIEIIKGSKIIWLNKSNLVYLEDMLNFFDVYFSSVIPVVAEGREVADFSEPRLHKLRGFEDVPLMFPSLPEPWETAKQYLDFAKLKEGDVVLDLGAYAGITAISFSREVGETGKVLAFEPDSRNRSCAEQNLKAVSAIGFPANTAIYDQAIWSHCDGISFSTEGAMGSSASEIVGGNRGHTIDVPTITLAKICEIEDLTKIDFIKMDIEGAEIEVLESSKDVLRKYMPKLIIEPHPVSGVMSSIKCRTILESLGYKVREIAQYGADVPLLEATPDNSYSM